MTISIFLYLSRFLKSLLQCIFNQLLHIIIGSYSTNLDSYILQIWIRSYSTNTWFPYSININQIRFYEPWYPNSTSINQTRLWEPWFPYSTIMIQIRFYKPWFSQTLIRFDSTNPDYHILQKLIRLDSTNHDSHILQTWIRSDSTNPDYRILETLIRLDSTNPDSHILQTWIRSDSTNSEWLSLLKDDFFGVEQDKTHYQTLIFYFCDFMLTIFLSIQNFFKVLNDVVQLTNRTSTIKLYKTSETLLEFPSYYAKDDSEKNLNKSSLSSTSVDFRLPYPETFNALCCKRCCWFKVVWDCNINLEKIARRSGYGRQYFSSWLIKQLFHYCCCYYFSFSL